jgi:predicted alpha/beta hydrolase family esterase
MADFHIVFIHGYTASSQINWYPQISRLLAEKDIPFTIPDLPGGKRPHVDEWLAKIHEAVAQSQKPLVLVGHSLGTRALLLYLEKYQPHLRAAFLIAAFNNELYNSDRYGGITYPDFFDHTIDLNIIKPLVDKFVVIHSKDDSSISYGQGEEIAQQLDADLRIYEGRGHFSDPKNADVILEELERVLHF